MKKQTLIDALEISIAILQAVLEYIQSIPTAVT